MQAELIAIFIKIFKIKPKHILAAKHQSVLSIETEHKSDAKNVDIMKQFECHFIFGVLAKDVIIEFADLERGGFGDGGFECGD